MRVFGSHSWKIRPHDQQRPGVAGEHARGRVCEAARDSVSVLWEQHSLRRQQPSDLARRVGGVVGDMDRRGRDLVPPPNRRLYQLRLKRRAAICADQRLERSADLAPSRSAGHDQNGGACVGHPCSNR
jgi:hypothetical protein